MLVVSLSPSLSPLLSLRLMAPLIQRLMLKDTRARVASEVKEQGGKEEEEKLERLGVILDEDVNGVE